MRVAAVLRSLSIAVSTVGLAALCVAGTAALWIGGPPPLGLFVLPVLASAWLGDALAAILATVLGLLTIGYLVPGTGLFHLGPSEYLRMLVFIAIGSSVAVLVTRLRASERRHLLAAAELRETGEHLRHALDAARMVAWRWDPASDEITRSGPVKELFGLQSSGSGRAFYEIVHPLDRDRYRQIVRDAITRRSGFTTILRMVRPDTGEVVWVEMRAAPLAGPGGAFAGLAGVAQHVTDRIELQAAIRARELQLRVIIDAVPALIAYVDADRHYELVNRGYEEWVGIDRDALAGRRMDDVLTHEDYAVAQPHVDAALAGTRVEFETETRHRDGSTRTIRAAYIPDFDADVVRGFFMLVLDVTDDRQRERALAGAEREARLANELKDQFLATLSHELRTPLNAILGYARLARMDAVSADRALDVIERNARLQTRLVEDLLDVSRMTTGKLQFVMAPVDVASAAVDVVQMLQPLAGAKAVHLVADVPADPPAVVHGDDERLRQMLTNLVGNAVKFTPAGGHVTVHLRHDGPQVELAIEDTGIGIDQAFLPVMFERFRQADSSASRAHGGLGLGLTIARSIAEAHGGSIAAASAGRGCGATFSVRLPLVQPSSVPLARATLS